MKSQIAYWSVPSRDTFQPKAKDFVIFISHEIEEMYIQKFHRLEYQWGDTT